MSGGGVLVLGSANVDSVVRLDRFPAPGETVFGRAGRVSAGGKGLNQAVAARLTGAPTAFAGMVGDDAGGSIVREALVSHGVDVSGLLVTQEAPTGSALISVDAAAENTIVVVSGANAAVSASDVSSLGVRGTVGLTQGELPAAAIVAFGEVCRREGLRFVLNLAPVLELPVPTLAQADPLIVNAGEARELISLWTTSRECRTGVLYSGPTQTGAGEEVAPAAVTSDLRRETGPLRESSPDAEIAEALDVARALAGTAASVVITLGADGAAVAAGDTAWHQSAPRPGQVVDTTGAGDAFVGALAARLAQGDSLAEAVRWGVRAGSVAVTAAGTVEAYAGLRDLPGFA